MDNLCPICKKDDQVQRIETLISANQASGVSTGYTVGTTFSNGKVGTTGGYAASHITLSTNLAKLLEPPVSPSKPQGYGCWWVLYGYLIIVVGVLFGAPFMIPGCVIMLISKGNDGVFLLGAILAIIGYGIGIGLAIIKAIKDDRKKKETSQKRFDEEMPKWQKAIQLWKRLYYCQRDGIVYDPKTGEYCSPENLKNFLYM
jgi:hypothetical protein